jgi:hypothetical protein
MNEIKAKRNLFLFTTTIAGPHHPRGGNFLDRPDRVEICAAIV